MAAFLGTRQLPTHASSCPFHVPCSVHTRPVIAGGFQLPALHQQLGSLAGPQIAARASGCSRVGRTQLKTQAGLFGNLGNIFNKDGAKVRRQMQPMVDKVNALEAEMQSLTDEQLKSKTDEFKQRLQKGQSLDDLLVEAFAVVREASKRVLGLRPFDVQLIGGMVLHNGQIAEMKTGEGKTLVAVLPAYLNALAGKGVQVVTVNDYLARRDSEWVGQVHRFLGLTVGLVQTNLNQDERRQAYAADVTYVTNSELGFDYLRENLATSKEELVLRGFDYCIVDEVDSILIDEARTPLIISGQSDKPSNKYEMTQKLAAALERDFHYTVDEKQKNVLLTEDGYEAAEQVLNVVDLYDPREQWASYIVNAVKAKELQKRDVNYIVRGSEIVIVDEFTGRTMPGRRWSDGLHQAVEAKEGVEIQNETITMASISYQNFFRGYKKKSGMTGTAATETAEFSNIYELTTSVIPSNRPNVRKDNSDVVFKSTEGKWSAVVQEISRMNQKGRPVLVGTTSVEQSEDLARRLDEENVKYQLLNAKPENVERESEIVAQSGRKGAVTIATNMAGRGTDIILGGNAEFQARLKLREMLMPEVVNQASSLEGSNNGKARAEVPNRSGKPKTWKVAPEIFPRELSGSAKQMAQEAVKAAKKQWGERQLEELEAEERLSVVCERGPVSDPVISQLREAFQIMEAEYKEVTETEKAEVVDLGGLHVVGTERHESRRIDNQLRGRGGRQGDPGSTRFFLSLEDPLFRVFGGERIQGMMKMFQIEDLPIESGMLTNALNEAQRKVESYFFDIRRQLFDYDMVMNTQRERVYSERRRALLTQDLSQQLVEYAERTVDDILEANVDASVPPEQWTLDVLANKMKQYCYLLEDLTEDMLRQKAGNDFEALRGFLRQRAVDAYWQKVQQVDSLEQGLMQEAQRFFVLTQTDARWKEHLQAIKFLQQAVGLRGYAQRDPLTEYKLEGYQLFLDMMAQIRRNVIYNVYCFEPKPQVQEQYRQKQEAQAKSKKEPAAAGGRRRR